MSIHVRSSILLYISAIQCPENLVYSPCVSMECQPTCDDIDGRGQGSCNRCHEGCACPTGTVKQRKLFTLNIIFSFVKPLGHNFLLVDL